MLSKIALKIHLTHLQFTFINAEKKLFLYSLLSLHRNKLLTYVRVMLLFIWKFNICCSLIYRMSRAFRSILQGLIPEVIFNKNWFSTFTEMFLVVVSVGMCRWVWIYACRVLHGKSGIWMHSKQKRRITSSNFWSCKMDKWTWCSV